eukprot:483307-Amphidinium_carterae.1
MQEFFTKTRLTDKQPGHRLWVNNKETRHTPPDLDKEQSDKIIDLTVKKEGICNDIDPTYIQPGGATVNIPPPPGLNIPIPKPEEAIPMQEQPPGTHGTTGDTIVDMEVDKPTEVYKPTHRLT